MLKESGASPALLRHLAPEECQWNISKAAEQLGMQCPNLYTKMKEYNIKRPKE